MTQAGREPRPNPTADLVGVRRGSFACSFCPAAVVGVGGFSLRCSCLPHSSQGASWTASPASAATVGQQAVLEASRQGGQPYVYGAAGPTKFDSSGYTMYVFAKMGKRLPHNASAQYSSSAVRHISQASKAVGDLLFMKNSGGRITHVGIYGGRNGWWVAPKSADKVKLQSLYSSNYVVARLR
jgi:cell wall-associated NlpC family hydrolase